MEGEGALAALEQATHVVEPKRVVVPSNSQKESETSPKESSSSLSLAPFAGTSIQTLSLLCAHLEWRGDISQELHAGKYLPKSDETRDPDSQLQVEEEAGVPKPLSRLRNGPVRSPFSTRILKVIQDLVEKGETSLEPVKLSTLVEVFEVLCLQHEVLSHDIRRKLLDTYESVETQRVSKEVLFNQLADTLDTMPGEKQVALKDICRMLRSGTEGKKREVAGEWAGKLLILNSGRFHPIKSFRQGVNAKGIFTLLIQFYGLPRPIQVATSPDVELSKKSLSSAKSNKSATSAKTELQSPGSESCNESCGSTLEQSFADSVGSSPSVNSGTRPKKRWNLLSSIKTKITGAKSPNSPSPTLTTAPPRNIGTCETASGATSNSLGRDKHGEKSRPKTFRLPDGVGLLTQADHKALMEQSPIDVEDAIKTYGRPPPPPPPPLSLNSQGTSSAKAFQHHQHQQQAPKTSASTVQQMLGYSQEGETRTAPSESMDIL